MIENPTKLDIDIFLRRLQQAGGTNMMGAGPYLMEAFGMTRMQARDALLDWMKNYKVGGNHAGV